MALATGDHCFCIELFIYLYTHHSVSFFVCHADVYIAATFYSMVTNKENYTDTDWGLIAMNVSVCFWTNNLQDSTRFILYIAIYYYVNQLSLEMRSISL